MRVSVVIWPNGSWSESQEVWRRAEEMGFSAAWVYDHVTWRGVRPWRDAYAVLSAAAAVTSRIRLGPLVTSPAFRHPVALAAAACALDDISGGRLTLGLGAGAGASDRGVIGDDGSAGDLAGRFAEFVGVLDKLLRQDELAEVNGRFGVHHTGRYWSAQGVDLRPGCVQRPRVPFAIAASGPRALALAARYADTWVTVGGLKDRTSAAGPVRSQSARLDEACREAGRDPSNLRRMLLTGQTDERWLDSYDRFEDLAGRYAELGITDLAMHWPDESILDGRYAGSMKVFERIAAA